MGSIPWGSMLEELKSSFTGGDIMGDLGGLAEGLGVGAISGAGYIGAKKLLGFGGGGGRKRRHMNVLNGHAAKRAIRRVAGAMRMLQQIERALPKRHAHVYHFPKARFKHMGRRHRRRHVA